MAGTGFGLPTRLLNLTSVTAVSLPSNPTPSLPIPPAPSFADFRFQNIGQQPRLLGRLTEASQTQDFVEDETMSTSSDNELRQQQNAEQNAQPRTRPSLWQALDGDTPFTSSPAINDNPAAQTSASSSPRFPVVEASLPDGHATQHPAGSKGKSTVHAQPSPSSTSSSLFDPSRSSASATSGNVDGHASHSRSGDSIASIHLNFSSASSGPSGHTDHPMEDVQHSRTPSRPSLPPLSRKYESLRQIHSRLQASTLNHNTPSLASAILLTNSAQQKAATVHAETRQLFSSTQELLQSAQKNFNVATALLRNSEEAKALAEGAKSELERISSALADQRRQSNQNEVDELLQSLGSWISCQEADEAALRACRAQQLELKKQKAEQARAATAPEAGFSTNASPTVDTTTITPPGSASIPPRVPLFYAPTPEVDVKVDPQAWSLYPSSGLTGVSCDPNERQTQLRRVLKEKPRPSDKETPAVSTLEAARLQQRRTEEERKRHLEEERRKQAEEARVKQEEMERRREEERRSEEERRREGERRREEERKREEERRKEERGQREILAKRQEEERGKIEEAERKQREERERELRSEAERLAREKTTREEEEKRKQEETERRKAREASELMRKTRLEVERRAKEGAERKAREADAQRKAQQEEEEKRKVALARQQEQELQTKLVEEARIRKLQEAREAQKKQEQLQEQGRQAKLLQEQAARRSQIQVDKDKMMADRAQQILAQRGHCLQSSMDTTSEMSFDSSSAGSNPISLPNISFPISTQSVPTVHSPNVSMSRSPSAHASPTETDSNGLPLALNQGETTVSQLPPQFTSSRPSGTAVQQDSHDPRPMSVPPVAYLPQPPPPTTSRAVPSQPTLSVYRLSGDSGNVPYRQTPNSPPQAQVANIRHVVNAHHLPFNLPVVKAESLPDDATLLYPSSDELPSRPLSSAETQPPIKHTQDRPPVPQEQSTPLPGTPRQPVHSLPVNPTNGSHTPTILDRRIPSSPAITDISAAARSRPQQQQQQQQQQQPTLKLTVPNSNPSHLPSRPLSASGSQPQSNPSCPPSRPLSASGTQPQSNPLRPPSRPLSAASTRPQLNQRPASRNEAPRQSALMAPINNRSPSSSPFRMGPDTYVPLPAADSPPDTSVDTHAPPTGPSYRGRNPAPISAPAHWDHYSPSPQRPRSLPRQTDTYRPNYSERSRSPPVQAGRKRSRDNSPPPPPVVRDYRDFRRRSRSPPRRIRRTPTPPRSPSPPGYRPLASRLTGPGDGTRRPPTPPRDSDSDQPGLLGRFSDTRAPGPPPPRPRIRHGKRGGRGGGGGAPPPGPSHPSLEQRISSGSTLMNRLEDPRKP